MATFTDPLQQDEPVSVQEVCPPTRDPKPLLVLEDLRQRTGVTNAQLDQVIDKSCIGNLAGLFDCCEDYIDQPGFGLEEADKTDVKDRAFMRGTKSAVRHAFTLWLSKNPYQTYRDLVNILLQLRKGVLADAVCRYVKSTVVDDPVVEPPVEVQPSVQGSVTTLKELVEKFDQRFMDLREAACKHMEDECVPVRDLRVSMMTLPKDINHQNEEFVRNNYPIFMKAKTIEEIFSHLNFYLSFIDYGLLEHIINRCSGGTLKARALKQQMTKYSEDMKHFRMETMISDIIPHLPRKSDSYEGASKLKLRLNVDVKTTSLEDLEAIRKQFASQLLLSDFILQLASIEDGSVVITCFIPSAIVCALNRHIKVKDSSFFSKLRILEIVADNIIAYDGGQELQTIHNDDDENSSQSEDPATVDQYSFSPQLVSPSCSLGSVSLVSRDDIPQAIFIESEDVSSVIGFTKMRGPVDTSISALGYFDIMLLGLTGQGKTTTAEKLLIANPTGVDYQAQYSFQVPTVLADLEYSRTVSQDLSMWHIPSDEFSLERISTRLKSLSFFRSLKEPSQEIIRAHEHDMCTFTRTKTCELFSNETTKVRVLDVPGFFGAVRETEPNSCDLILDAMRAHLGTMRSILQIQTTMNMKFKRILYFLPCRDTLQTHNAGLQQELQMLFYFFGRSIFENMALVATVGPLFYRMVPESTPIQIPDDELERSKRTFREALKTLIPDDTPNPPIIFISLRETCESIFEKVRGAQVTRDGLQLELNTFPCNRCSMTIGERNGERIACMEGTDWSRATAYKESFCHPLFVPKYTRFQKAWKGIQIAVKALVGVGQMDFSVLNGERCPHCLREIDSRFHDPRGCMRMGSEYHHKDIPIVVEHTRGIGENHRMLVQSTRFNAPFDQPSDYSHETNTIGYQRLMDTQSRADTRLSVQAGYSSQTDYFSDYDADEVTYREEQVFVDIEP